MTAPHDQRHDPWAPIVDVMIHLPVGVALELRKICPGLIENGRRHSKQQTQLARFVGEFAVGVARRKATQWWQSQGASVGADRRAAASAEPPTGDAVAAKLDSAAAVQARTSVDDAGAGVADMPPAASPSASVPPLAGYDELSAVQVISRLADLDGAQLDDVAQYEAAHRRRRTVLGRIEELRRG